MKNTLKSLIAGVVLGFFLFAAGIPILGALGIKAFEISKSSFWAGFVNGFGGGFGIIVGLIALNWVVGRVDKASSGS